MIPEKRISFESPLEITSFTEFTKIEFGAVLEMSEIIKLREELNRLLFNIALSLPDPLNREAQAIISGYSGGDGDFYRLFYVPVWSFLHWVPLKCSFRDVETVDALKTAHGLSLFIHLWDDHLCDGQLPVDLLKLQLRTIAWQQMVFNFNFACQRLGINLALVEEYTSKYLKSLHFPKPVNSLEEYCQRFKDQVSIWTLGPYLLGYYMGGYETAGLLRQMVEHFSISWRLIDDIQDIHLDLLASEKSSIWIELDNTGHQMWSSCFEKSEGKDELDKASWQILAGYINESGCLKRLLHMVAHNLKLAAETADIMCLKGLSLELEQELAGIPTIGTTIY